MTANNNRTSILERLSQRRQLAFAEPVPNAIILTEIVSELNSLSQGDKFYFKDFAANLKAELFTRGITIKGLSISQFEKSVNEDFHQGENGNKEISRQLIVKTEFQELFKKLTQTLTEHFEILKGYFIVRLENDPLDSYKLMVLHDSTFFIQPIKKKIFSTIPNTTFREIEDFSNDLRKGNFEQTNLLCLLLLHPRTNDEKGIIALKDSLSTIVESFKGFESFSLRSNSLYESSISKEDFFEEVEFVNATLLSNGAIRHEEEKIIKKLFRNFQTPLLIYKTLSGGKSGTKVIEIRPKKELGHEYEKRYIIKYSEKDLERKIDAERKCFGKWVGGYKGFKEYECEYDKTLTHEGLRYSYAISDTASESFSYSEILSKQDNGFHADKAKIVDDLFSIDIYKVWRDSLAPIDCKTSNLYESYIKIDKTFEEVGRILNQSVEKIRTEELYANFYKIWNYNFQFNKKVCHGDLHSENFFKDQNGIYLIDFGYTGIQHAVIDHTSLECSIKFKHFPFYVSIEELNSIEEELILETSFQLSHRFTRTTRTDLLELLEIVKKIRSNSVSLMQNNNSMTEYLISIFMMTFRQIKYRDLNQLYAYNSALVISRRLIQLLKIQ